MIEHVLLSLILLIPFYTLLYASWSVWGRLPARPFWYTIFILFGLGLAWDFLMYQVYGAWIVTQGKVLGIYIGAMPVEEILAAFALPTSIVSMWIIMGGRYYA